MYCCCIALYNFSAIVSFLKSTLKPTGIFLKSEESLHQITKREDFKRGWSYKVRTLNETLEIWSEDVRKTLENCHKLAIFNKTKYVTFIYVTIDFLDLV